MVPIKKHFDIIISGGGLAGMWLALQLATDSSWSILVVERGTGQSLDCEPLDSPSLALTSFTLNQLGRVGVCVPSTPIESIHVSEHGVFGSSVLSADTVDRNAYGGVVEVGLLYAQIRERLLDCKRVDVWVNSQISAWEWLSHRTLEIVHDGQAETVAGTLLIAADGAQSPTRSHLGIESRISHYGQVALQTNIQLNAAPKYSAYERFAVEGPRALLPLSDCRMALVWVVDQLHVQDYLAQSKSEWLAAINEEFGSILGAVAQDCGCWRERHLVSVIPDSQTRYSAVLVGNAAHTIHPVAGQGFNLTTRDLGVLVKVLRDIDLVDSNALNQSLQHYEALRRTDQYHTYHACDVLLKLFGVDRSWWKVARGFGLLLLDHARPLKNRLALRAMGE